MSLTIKIMTTLYVKTIINKIDAYPMMLGSPYLKGHMHNIIGTKDLRHSKLYEIY
jgi:hypothetical protein